MISFKQIFYENATLSTKEKVASAKSFDEAVTYILEDTKLTHRFIRDNRFLSNIFSSNPHRFTKCIVNILSDGKYDIQDGKYIIKSEVYIPSYFISNGKFIFDISEVTVEGDFYCSSTNLTSLEGAPQTVEGSFRCSNNPNLTSLEGAPQTVGEYFDCSHNKNLTSLEGAPQTVGRSFRCSLNENLTSLEGAPQNVGEDFDCSYNPNLTSLEGAPQTVGGDFSCNDNPNLTETYEEYLQRIKK